MKNLNRKTFETTVAGRPLVLEISDIGRQANAAVIGKYGETIVLVTAVMTKENKGVDYLPLLVDYEEKFYAAGKIIGSRFIRREGRPSEEAILSGRLIDRTIRPLFDQRLRRQIQIVATVLSIDEENEPDFVSLVAASTALMISDIPWNGPAAGAEIAALGEQIVINPLNSELKDKKADFEAFVAGAHGKINMIELIGNEAPEELVIKGFEKAREEIEKLIEWQKKIAAEVGRPKADVELALPDRELESKVKNFVASKLEDTVYVSSKTGRQNKLGELKKELLEHLKNEGENRLDEAAAVFEEEVSRIVHQNIIEKEKRPDGRRLDEIRNLHSEVRLFERPHGSALFTRGDTQALAVTTLGAPGTEQLIETMETSAKRRFMLHYNFPPYSVGEIGSFRGPGRREIGHGALAEKALRNLIPSQEEFPYTIRVVSEILSSNGSSSMATVSAASLSLMDAGVPLKRPAAGIAVGLMTDGKTTKLLTDIQGPEDHHGDMDLKVAGTERGITAVQMDVKIDGLDPETLEKAVQEAKKAREEILKTMKTALPAPRPEVSPYAPVISVLEIDPEKIGEVIGPGGKIINRIIEISGEGTVIDIEQTGKVYVAAPNKRQVESAIGQIKAITREYQPGETVEGEVIKILDFGAIVDLGGGRDGMIHVSELKNGFVKNVEEVVKIGDRVRAKIIRVENGRIALSLKGL